MHNGEMEMTTTERSAFDNTSPSHSPDQLTQSTAVSVLPLMQAIFPSEEQKIENILQQIEEHKQPGGAQRGIRPGELNFNQ